MAYVVLLYERTCPNVVAARTHLLQAFSLAGVPAAWREVDRDAADTPAAWRLLGSPTVLVDGLDVAPAPGAEGASCRVYEGGSGAPSVALIATRLRQAQERAAVLPRAAPGGAAARALAAAPGVVLALLPKGMCPACWPAYAAVLSALGLGFLMQDRYLLPLTAAFLVLATAALGYRAEARRGYGPAIVGGLSGLGLLLGKFVLDGPPAAAYLAVGVFTIAALWNAWPRRRAASCAACPPGSSLRSSL